MPALMSNEAFKCPNNMKKCLCSDDLASVYKHVETVLLIEFLDMVLDPEPERHTGQIEVCNSIFLHDDLFEQLSIDFSAVCIHISGLFDH